MKKLIIILGTIILGVYIYGLLLGDEPDTVKSKSKEVMQQQVEFQKITP